MIKFWRYARLENRSLLSKFPAYFKTSIVKFIRGFAACWVFFDIPKGDEFTQGLVGFVTLSLGLVHEGWFR